MTAYVINAGGTTRFDSLTAPSANATLDTYTISNNTTLLIDTDSYLCANRSAATGSLDTVSFTGTGGVLRIDGNSVWVIPYNAGTGNVPAIGAAISQGIVTATVLGVWANWQSEPTASGSAMPTTGFIKIRALAGGIFTAGAITGIGATATGPSVRGWIEVRGADTATITVPRVGKFEVNGDWFELGTTNGTRGQVLACPTTATVAGVFPGVWIETAAGSGVYERFVGAGSMVAAATTPIDERGKIFWQTTAGIRLGSDGTNNVGFLPPTGCKVRIPNVILTCCTRTASGSGPRVLPNATLATRQEFVTTSAGAIDIKGAVANWYCNFSQPFSVKLRDTAISDTLVLSEVSAALDTSNAIVAPTQAQLNLALNITSCFGGGTVGDSAFARFSLATSGSYVNSVAYAKGISFPNCRTLTLTNRANGTTGTWTVIQAIDCFWPSPDNIGGRMLFSTCVRPKIADISYADAFSGTTQTANPNYGVEAASGTSGLEVTGFDFFGLTNVQPYNGLVSAAASYQTLVKEIGTFASPLNLGTVNAAGVVFNGGGNNDGIRLKRCYVSNTRLGPYQFVNSDNDVVIENVAGDYADTSVIASLNTVTKGNSLVGATTGQTSVYGTIWVDRFTAATSGFVEVMCNEPTTASASQCAITGGTPKFTSSGSVAITADGDQVTWTSPYFIKGHTAFANIAPTLTGTLTGNLTMQYQLDTGSGFGAVKTLSAANLSGETISPSIGFRLRIIASTAVSNATNALTNIRIPTITTAAAQSTNLYPLSTVNLTLTGLQLGSDVVVYQAGTTTVRYSLDANPGSSATYTYETPESVDVGVFLAGYVPFYIRGLTLAAVDASLPVAQTADRAYLL